LLNNDGGIIARRCGIWRQCYEWGAVTVKKTIKASTNTEQRYLRSYQTLIDDCVIPLKELREDRRYTAIIEVLRRFPDSAYQLINYQIDSFHWFIPDYQLYGKVEPVFATDEFEIFPGKPVKGSRVIYFTPRLEDESQDIVIAVVAHELAHIALGHKVAPPQSEYDRQEKQVFESLAAWGFDKEIAKHRASLSARGLE
jgi:hypothetical protein